MSEGLRGWLDGRAPPPPEALRDRIREAVSHAEAHPDAASEPDAAAATSSPVLDALLRAGVDRLSRARQRPGRVRETAFELLVADALITYACEAALESEDPEEGLAAILTLGRTA